MTQPSTQQERRPTSYWVITALAWSYVAVLVVMSIKSLLDGDIVSCIGFAVFAAMFLIAMLQPKWFQRFARWYNGIRG